MTGVPPGPRSPQFVQTFHWVRQPIPYMYKCRGEYGDCFTMRLIGLPSISLFTDPRAIKQIFTADADDAQAGKANGVLKPILGANSVLLLDGDKHKRERKLLMPSFHGERMRHYGETMRTITDASLEKWPREQPFPIHERMQAITLNIILQTVFGVSEGHRLRRLRSLLIEFLSIAGNSPLLLVRWLQVNLGPLTGWRRMTVLGQEIDNLLYEEIRERKLSNDSSRTDIMTMLLLATDEDGRGMSDEELRDEMVTMLLAGHETTTTSLSWVIYRLLKHPTILEAARSEINAVVGSSQLETEHISELEYLDAVIKETARLHPIVPLVARYLTRDTTVGQYRMPAGTVASPCIYLTHRRPDLWPDPDVFDPERFLGKRVDPYSFFPFGGGNRHCLGAAFATFEMKIVLAQVLSKVSLRTAPGPDITTVRRSITFAPSAGMPVICTGQ